MPLPRTRNEDVLQSLMTSFSQFERKLDKLQDDVSHHGQTLTELHGLVNNLSINTIATPDKQNVFKQNKNTERENKPHVEEPQRPRRKNVGQSLPIKLRGINLPGQKSNDGGNTHPPSPKAVCVTVKRSPRPKKAEAPRKATTLRSHKTIDKKRSKRTDA